MTPSNGEQMMNCPKCGFEQPVDQYCAKCGIDMAKTLKASAGIKGMFKKPAMLAGMAVLLGGIGFAAYRNSLQNSASVAENLELESDVRAKSRLSGKASGSAVDNLRDIEDSYVSENDQSQVSESSPQVQPTIAVEPDIEAQRKPLLKITKTPVSTKTTVGTGPSASAPPEMLVVFAWAEVSKEWLHAIGASEPGFHQIQGLETKLRQSAGSFRIVDVTRRRLKDDSEPVIITKADQTVFFEPISVKPKSLTGGFTAQFKSAQGEVRAPAAATASLLKGTGAIIPMGPSISSQGTEIVVFILPRWEND